jgi:hypothetical protein
MRKFVELLAAVPGRRRRETVLKGVFAARRFFAANSSSAEGRLPLVASVGRAARKSGSGRASGRPVHRCRRLTPSARPGDEVLFAGHLVVTRPPPARPLIATNW